MLLMQQLSAPPNRSPQLAWLSPPPLTLHWPHCASQQTEPSVLGMPLLQVGSGAEVGAAEGSGHVYVIR